MEVSSPDFGAPTVSLQCLTLNTKKTRDAVYFVSRLWSSVETNFGKGTANTLGFVPQA